LGACGYISDQLGQSTSLLQSRLTWYAIVLDGLWLSSTRLREKREALSNEFSRAFIERYGFLKAPQTLEEFDLEKGVVFQSGRFGSVSIVGITFFRNGIVVDTRSSTEDAENFLSDAGEWAEQFFGIEHSPNRISRKMF